MKAWSVFLSAGGILKFKNPNKNYYIVADKGIMVKMKSKKIKLLLIHPALGEVDSKVTRKRKAIFPPLSLGVLAGMTPGDFEVTLIDENIEEVDFQTPADLVAITVMTAAAPRAYQIADKFRSQGAMVILGGIHPSALPDEAAEHADAVGVGEAESYWPQLIEDFKKGMLKACYGPGERLNPFWTPEARTDLFERSRYLLTNNLQTTRGCPFACNFCSVSHFFGRTYRFRPIDDILREVSRYKGKLVGFVDDNIIGNVKRAKELFRALLPYNIRWISQASINLGSDDELLALAAASGCTGVFIGLESLEEANIKAMNKRVNRIEGFERAIKKIQSYGIAIEGAFIFGLDEDDESIFERTVKFAKRMKLAAAQFGVLTPYPGTKLYQKLSEEGRIFDFNWAHYDISRVVYWPKKMSPQVLQEGFNWAWRQFYTYPSILKRLSFLKKQRAFTWALNFAFRSSVKHSRIGK